MLTIFDVEGTNSIMAFRVGIPLYVYHKKYQNLRTNIVFDGTQELNNFVDEV